MLSTKTVLILGAGASEPFGFPTGIGLSEMVWERLQNNNATYTVLREFGGFDPQVIDEFRDAFYYSGKNSVDAFLEHRSDLITIGKAVTAAILVEFESPWHLFRFRLRNNARNWLRTLYNNLNASFAEFGANELSIVTFNYDRTVEHFLFTSLQRTYDKSERECVEVLTRIPIIHLHGQLGLLPWQSKEGRSYETHLDHRTLMVAANSIKIIHEDIKDGRDEDFQRAKHALKEAKRVIFMGFGYNPTNLSRLGIADLDGPDIRGSCVGLGNQEIEWIADITNRKVQFFSGDCDTAIREEIRWG